MVQRIGGWFQLVEAMLVIAVLLAISWLALQAFADAYAAVFRILNGF